MVKAIIIEEENNSKEAWSYLLADLPVEVKITAKLKSVKEAVQYFLNHPEADIIFSDIQLSDGLSFEIFRQTEIGIPVVFTTCYNQFLLTAFEHNGIDYLIKPIEKGDVLKALGKFEKLKEHFSQMSTRQLFSGAGMLEKVRRKTRIIARNGCGNILVRIQDIILFFTEGKVVYLIDNQNRKFPVDYNLTELETFLDAGMFFRANRQFIINLNYVQGFRTFEKVKLLIELSTSAEVAPVIVSQETAPEFRNWIRNA